ncbi:AraC family transcriptional regulator [Polaribacter sp.]|uniref:AraC family transcriptional regulator n=1 Tax=Polaribacter sp. TaxID=1920175 RepID=UPI0025EB23EA|nr:AraC family transcriptional regulator [Polaribacter sp.]
MKLHLLNRSTTNNSSFTTRVNEYPYFLKIWHYHPELELVIILKSEGTCFIGDGIEKFKKGDVVLIGENLPHIWVNDDAYFNTNSNENAKAISIHFKQDFLGDGFIKKPEMSDIFSLFEEAKQGLKFLNVKDHLIQEIKEMLNLSGFEKTIVFLLILNKLAKHSSIEKIASQGYTNHFKSSKNDTQNKVQSYIFKNFNQDISLVQAANIAHMNPSAFSRYFKHINRKTFTKYVSEIRIGYACKLLIENKFNISEICYESGFKNISNFNRQFKIIMKCTPSEYLKNYKTQLLDNK